MSKGGVYTFSGADDSGAVFFAEFYDSCYNQLVNLSLVKERMNRGNQEKSPGRRAEKQAHAGRQITSRKPAKKQMHRSAQSIRYFLMIPGLIIILLTGLIGYRQYLSTKLSDEVLSFRPMVKKYAAQYGISGYTDELLAIMQVESRGQGNDVMQSSESLGLSVNTLNTEESIAQGTKYFSEILAIAEKNRCDLDTAIQAYNYGKGYVYYVAEHGRHHTQELAEQFAKEKSGGRTESYPNPVAVLANGGWRYKYGNMFYVKLVHKYT